MADGKTRNVRRAALGLGAAALVWLFGVWPPPVWWRDHWPRATAMKRSVERQAGVAPLGATPLDAIAPALRRTVLLAEDARFRNHWGIDVWAIREAAGVPPQAGPWHTLRAAWRERRHIRGASTITQQLAKNLYLSPSRNPLRKVKEAATAVRLELALSKDRILELYLNVAEWGPGIWGADAASHAYFGLPASELAVPLAAALAATLPHPRTSNPAFHPAAMAARRDLILARYYGADVVIPPAEPADELAEIRIDAPPVLIPPALDSLLAQPHTPRDSAAPE
jgi:monofunctional biosynthetic peptidoglycan transglycosylase